MKKQRGLSLVELVVFIVVFAIAMTGLTMSFKGMLNQSAENPQNIQASYLAEARMNLLLLYKLNNGLTFSSPNWTLTDPCASPVSAACVALQTYQNSTGLTASATFSNDSTGTTATMSVTGDGRATEVLRFTP